MLPLLSSCHLLVSMVPQILGSKPPFEANLTGSMPRAGSALTVVSILSSFKVSGSMALVPFKFRAVSLLSARNNTAAAFLAASALAFKALFLSDKLLFLALLSSCTTLLVFNCSALSLP